MRKSTLTRQQIQNYNKIRLKTLGTQADIMTQLAYHASMGWPMQELKELFEKGERLLKEMVLEEN
jgi:hypothetical protein